MNTRLALAGAGLAALLFAARPASAQTPIGLATSVESDGFRITDQGRLHVGGNVDLRYDSNPTYLPTAPVGDLALRIRARLGLGVPSEKLELMLNVSVDWTQYMGVENPATRTGLSSFQGMADFGLLVNKNGFMNFFLTESLMRAEVPANGSLSERLRSVRNFTRIGTDIRPGGRALEFRATYGLDFVYYDLNQFSVLDPASLSAMTHVPAVRAMWRFFPKTALTLDVEGAFTRYPFPSQIVVNPNLNALRAQAGLLGLITDKISVNVKAGYANTFIEQTAGAPVPLTNFQSVIGLAQVTWRPSELMTLSGGYARDFSAVSIYGWLSYDRGFAEFQQLFYGRFILNLRAQYSYETFGQAVVPGLTGTRHDHVIQGEARFTYQALHWLAGSVFYLPEVRLTPFVSPAGVVVSGGPTGLPGGVSGQYMRHVVGLDVSMAY